MWHYFCSPCASISDSKPDPNPNPNPIQYPESCPNPILIPNSNPTKKWSLFSRLAEHRSRDHTTISFSPITHQGCIFTLRHAGWFGISAKKYVLSCLQIPEILKYKDVWKFLGEWFSIRLMIKQILNHSPRNFQKSLCLSTKSLAKEFSKILMFKY